MNSIDINLLTLILVLSLILSTQIVALFVQYRVNRTYRGIGSWLIGASLMALGFILMPMVAVKPLEFIARIANPLLVLGHIFLYRGIKKFFDKKCQKWIPISIFIVFSMYYYYYMYMNNNVYARTIVISIAIATISFMMAYELFLKKDKFIAVTANFTAAVFFVYGCFYTIHIFRVSMVPSGGAYNDHVSILISAFFISIVISNLWTFGFIMMVNQRLNIENKLEKEKLQFIFNTNIDAQLITQLEDGLVVDVNDEFCKLSGYAKEEIIGTSLPKRSFWHNIADRQLFISELNDKGICENIEFIFERKDKRQFTGTISGKIIVIHSKTHIISVVRDITERKLIEAQVQQLIQELEIERNIAQFNSITDSLTGLANRGYFDEALKNEFSRLMRTEGILSLIMLDIDYFKKFNDSYGHLAGDQCLQTIATTLKTIARRGSDIVARYGGEEFIVILPDTDENGAKSRGEEIRKAIEALAIPHIVSNVSKYVTISGGIVTVYPADFESPEEVLKLVDDALYSAKAKGRNRCVYSSKALSIKEKEIG